MRDAKPHRVLLALGALLAAGAPARAAAEPFPHKAHLDEGLECAGCHDTSGPGLPTPKRDVCTDCHEGVPSLAGGKPWRRLAAAFPHPRHVDAQECRDCHAGTLDGSRKAASPLVPVTRCFDCHRENGLDVPESRCAACHGPGRPRTPPADHGEAWPARHGREAEWRVFGDHGRDCRLCHEPRQCDTCHQSRRPASHTVLWRVRLHGQAAGWDRDGCRTCHEPGACVSCHRRTEPDNHRGAWRADHGLAAGTRTSENCAACHAAGWCESCHRGQR